MTRDNNSKTTIDVSSDEVAVEGYMIEGEDLDRQGKLKRRETGLKEYRLSKQVD